MKKGGRYLIVKGTCGLGNRLMTLANALEYCEKTGRIISIDWCDGMFAPKGVNAFSEYFEIRDFVWQEEINAHKNDATSFYPDVLRNLPDDFGLDEYFHTSAANKKGSKLLERLIHFGSGVIHTLLSEDYFKFYFVLWVRWELLDCHINIRSSKLGGNIFGLGGNLPLARKEDVIIFGDFCPSYHKEYLTKHVFLKEKISEEIKNFSKNNGLSEGTLGLHVRCTDKSFEQDIDKLFQIVESIMLQQHLDKIFLATDQIKIVEKARQNWGNKLILYNKYLPELKSGGTQGMHTWASEQEDDKIRLQIYHDAIVEMYLLAETKYLLYQGNSTFSTISRDMNQSNNCYDWQKKII